MNPDISNNILAWYDKNARVLPWRISPQDRKKGIIPNPYYVWLSEIMLQQTTVATVIDYYYKFITKWQTIQDLANASHDDIMLAWAGLGYYSRARNLHQTAKILMENYQGIFPSDENELIKLSGIGRYSAASIAAIAFDKSAAVMDGNIERIIARLYCVQTPLPTAKKELYDLTKKLTPKERAGDYAQAMMDLGATICTPKKPSCTICPINQNCQAYKIDTPENYPYKIPKKEKPSYQGTIFLITDGYSIIVEKRPHSGLFGGMDIFPYINPHEIKINAKNNEFTDISIDKFIEKIVDKYSFSKKHQNIGKIKHVFTHFTFYADITMIEMKDIILSDNNTRLIPIESLNQVALPTLMQKAFMVYKNHCKQLVMF